MTYSQYGQDLLVLWLLGGKREGFFLDSGAADGVIASNTLLLEVDYGWRGICVEPDQRMFAALVRNRRCQCVNCCLYNREGEVQFVKGADTLGGIISEYEPSSMKFAVQALGLPCDTQGRPPTVLRPARLTQSVLEECGAPPVIDYWSLDTEGSELAILEAFPFDRYHCRVITVEHNLLPVRERIKAFLEDRGYRRVAAVAIDDCYAADGIALPTRAWRSAAWPRATGSTAT